MKMTLFVFVWCVSDDTCVFSCPVAGTCKRNRFGSSHGALHCRHSPLCTRWMTESTRCNEQMSKLDLALEREIPAEQVDFTTHDEIFRSIHVHLSKARQHAPSDAYQSLRQIHNNNPRTRLTEGRIGQAHARGLASTQGHNAIIERVQYSTVACRRGHACIS